MQRILVTIKLLIDIFMFFMIILLIIRIRRRFLRLSNYKMAHRIVSLSNFKGVLFSLFYNFCLLSPNSLARHSEANFNSWISVAIGETFRKWRYIQSSSFLLLNIYKSLWFNGSMRSFGFLQILQSEKVQLRDETRINQTENWQF